MSDGNALGRALLAECERRLFGESEARLVKCLGLLSDAQIWQRPGPATVSVGNLVLHLCGNVRQWIVAGLGGARDQRRRDSEFAERGPIPRAELLALLDRTLREAETVLRALPPESLLTMHRVQAFDESALSILVHVVEHFSYHVGQVTYMTKCVTGRSTDYYAGVDLGARG